MNLFLDPSAPAPDREPARRSRQPVRRCGPEAVATRIVDRYAAEVGDRRRVARAVQRRRDAGAAAARARSTRRRRADVRRTSSRGRRPELGAFHAVDIPFTFDTFDVDGWGEFVGFDADADAARSRTAHRVGRVRARRRSRLGPVPDDACLRTRSPTTRPRTRCSRASSDYWSELIGPSRERARRRTAEHPFDVG